MEYVDPQRPRRLGRPLSFDRDVALQTAMLTFWRHGYETTSVADLTAAMGVTAPSLYTAFGDKKQLFLEAVRLYAGDPDVMARAIGDAPSALEAARDLMTAAATAYTGEETPRGCLLASATASGSAASCDVQQAVADIRRGVQRRLDERIQRDIADGALPLTTNPAELSGLVMAVIQGMSVLARDGASRASLLATVQAALRAWPGMGADR
ncbi:TetR/AcrR family transcriptional regulator [Caulobacter sp. DWR2-3-1b2]|uniref:TetR/AcrR family transcriptional regulator n=1 Tax=Caulobacter sp. DWR2-3-1b2 TaxID=2804642 RepID=UPI003CF5C92A